MKELHHNYLAGIASVEKAMKELHHLEYRNIQGLNNYCIKQLDLNQKDYMLINKRRRKSGLLIRKRIISTRECS